MSWSDDGGREKGALVGQPRALVPKPQPQLWGATGRELASRLWSTAYGSFELNKKLQLGKRNKMGGMFAQPTTPRSFVEAMGEHSLFTLQANAVPT